MYKMSVCKKFVSLVFLICSAMPGLALPKYERTILPFPNDLDEIDAEDRNMIKEVLALSVHQDAEDANQYYYVPKFHIRQYREGAAGMMLHAHNVKQYAAANKEMDTRTRFAQEYTNQKYEVLQIEVTTNEKKVEEAQEKLEEAIALGNQQLIALRKSSLERKDNAHQLSIQRLSDAEIVIKSGGSLMPAGLGKSYFERALLHLAQAGMDVPYVGGEAQDEVQMAIKNALQALSSSYGGYLSVNTYAGFTKAQLDALVAYRSKYMPHIKVTLLPIEELSFFPLTEWKNALDNSLNGNKIFREIRGSGDYLGAAIVMDTTIAGSLGLVEHLAPFVLPVGIKVRFKQKMKPAEAELTCDFSNGFEVKGRADVRDGLIIYDNDITNTIKASDKSHGACNLTILKGDPKSAEFAALRHLDTVFEAMRLQRTELSRQEKEKYFNGVQADIQNNRREEEPTYTNVLRTFSHGTWQTVVIEGLTRAADFHWHTNIQDVSNISSVKFTKRVSINGHETVERHLSPNLCLVYDSALKAYVRCTEIDENEAKNIRYSMEDAHRSPECKDAIDPYDCGNKRDNAGRTPRRGYTPPENDNLLMSSIR